MKGLISSGRREGGMQRADFAGDLGASNKPLSADCLAALDRGNPLLAVRIAGHTGQLSVLEPVMDQRDALNAANHARVCLAGASFGCELPVIQDRVSSACLSKLAGDFPEVAVKLAARTGQLSELEGLMDCRYLSGR